jgi:kinesin family protein C1
MEGPEGQLDEPEKLGMIPRAVFQIFESAEKLKEKNWNYVIEAQYLEIYNETIRDLLNTSEESKKMDIRHSGGKTLVTDSVTGNEYYPSDE